MAPLGPFSGKSRPSPPLPTRLSTQVKSSLPPITQGNNPRAVFYLAHADDCLCRHFTGLWVCECPSTDQRPHDKTTSALPETHPTPAELARLSQKNVLQVPPYLAAKCDSLYSSLTGLWESEYASTGKFLPPTKPARQPETHPMHVHRA